MNAQSYRRYIEIWERHREEIWRFIQSRLRNSSEQEDILQEVFLALYQKLDSGEEIQNARAWLYKTAHNQCCSKIHDLQSVRERMVSMDDDLWRSQEPCDEGADPAVPSISEEQVYRWRDDLLERLEKDERAFLEDTYVRRLPVPDIMRKWNIKAPAVYQRQRRLRLKLQRMSRELMENRDW